MSSKAEEEKAKRLTLTFDCTDDTQKMVYDILKTAGYGKRAPLVVKAMCQMIGDRPVSDFQKCLRKHPQEREAYAELEKIINVAVKASLLESLPLLTTGISENLQSMNGISLKSDYAKKEKRTDEEIYGTENGKTDSLMLDALKLAELFG